MTNQKLLPTLALIFTIFAWGMSFLSIKLTVEVIPPMTLGLLRFAIASILLTLVMKVKKPETKVSKKDMPLLAIAGFIGVTLYFFFENNGIKLLQASTASIVIATIPIFTLIFESIIFKVKLTKFKILSVIISFGGVIFVVGGGFGDLSTQTITGCLLMLGAVLSWVVYSLVTKPLFGRYSQISIVYYQTLFGTLLFIPFALMETVKWNLITGTMVLNVLYLGILCSAVGYYTYVYAMENLGVSTSSLYLNIMPLITVLASFIILKERISLVQMLGGVLIILSVYLSNWKEVVSDKESDPNIPKTNKKLKSKKQVI